MNVVEDFLDEDDEDVEPIPVPEDPTVKDLIDAVDNLASVDQYDYFYVELYDNCDDAVVNHLWDIRDTTAAATQRVLVGIPIEDMVGELPITIIPRKDFEILLASARAGTAALKPMESIDWVDRNRAHKRLKQMFPEVDEGDLPPNELWNLVMREATSAVLRIKAARKYGVPDPYIRRCALTHLKTFIVGKGRTLDAQRQNFAIIARFLKNMGFGSDEDIAFFERLASGDGGQG